MMNVNNDSSLCDVHKGQKSIYVEDEGEKLIR